MANIDIKLSATVVDHVYGYSNMGSDLGAMIDAFAQASAAASTSASYGASWSLVGSTLRIDFGNGARLDYTGVVVPNLAAQYGTATATGVSFYQSGVLSMSQSGRYDVGYSMIDGTLNITSISGTTTGGQVATLIPTWSTYYDPTMGNVRIGFSSNLYTDSNGNASGDITRITASADKLLKSGVIDGSFHFSGDMRAIGQELSHAAVSGTLTGYRADYMDGSYESISGAALRIDADESIEDALLDPANLSGDDIISVDLPANLQRTINVASGEGNDRITVKGGGLNLNVSAGAGNDIVTVASSSHKIDGGSGIDTVHVGGARADYSVTVSTSGVTLNNAAAQQTLTGIERIEFADGSLALDIDGNAGQAYRLYQAAFNRQPDLGGQGYYIKALDGGMSLLAIAQNFLNSPEFAQTYGSNATDADFITAMYRNALHREPDSGGFAYYADALQHGLSRAQMLINFSESPENKAQVIGAIDDGIAYQA